MLVARQGFAEALLFHDGKADAVGELPVFVAAAAEEIQSRRVKRRAGGQHAKLGVGPHGILEDDKLFALSRRMKGVAQFDQDVFGGQEGNTFLPRPPDRPRVAGVGGIQQGDEVEGVGKKRGHYFLRWPLT